MKIHVPVPRKMQKI